MNKKITVTAMSLLAAVTAAAGVVFSVSAEDTQVPMYEADKVFSQNTAPITYFKDGSVQIGNGDGSDDADKWTNAGEYSFSTAPFSMTFRMNGVPDDGKIKRNYFFLNEEGSEKTVWFNVLVVAEGGGYSVKTNINIKDQKPIADNYVLATLTAGELISERITFTYHASEKTASIAVGERRSEFDLNKAVDGSEYQYGDELPDGNVKPALMNTNGGIVVEEINGSKFIAPDIEEPFDAKANLNKDFIAPDAPIDVEYADRGIVLGAQSEGDFVHAAVNENYSFRDTLEVVLRYNGLQPAAAASNKTTYITITDGTDGKKQITVKLFAYCTSDDEAEASYILHAAVYSGEEMDGQYYTQNPVNLLQDLKDHAGVAIRVRYESENRKLKIYAGELNKLVVDLTKTAEGDAADTDFLPTADMVPAFEVQHGGIVLERVNDQNFKFHYSDYELGYTDKRDFFTDDSTARISYRNAGVLITNNDRNNMDYANAAANAQYTSLTGNMIFTFRFDALNDYIASIPLTVQKMVQFEITDASHRKLVLMPFLYKAGNVYMLHCHIQLVGYGFVYENYYVNFELSASEAVSEELWIKYDSTNLVVELGYPDQFTTLDLTKAFSGVNQKPAPDTTLYPAGELRLEKIHVQFSGIYLRRYNQFSFVVENPETPDPVDPTVTSYGLEDQTFDPSLRFTPAFDKGGYDDATLAVFFKKSTDTEYVELTAEDGVYSVELDGLGIYQFKYVISFDGVEISTVKSVSYSSTLFEDIPSLFTKVSVKIEETEQGMKLDTGIPENNSLGRALGQFSVSGRSTVIFRLANLFEFVPGTQMAKETWVDFSDGKNAVWVKALAFASDQTNGGFWAYTSIMTYKGGNTSDQQIVRENVRLNFNFDVTGELDPDVFVEVCYEPDKNMISVGKAGSELMSFDLSAVAAPSHNYNINFGVTFGAAYITQINGVSFVTAQEGYEFPAPVINEAAIPTIVIDGDKIVLPQNLVYDIFDRRPQYTVVLKDEEGNTVELKETENGMLTTEHIAIGNYTLTVTAVNAREKEMVKEFTVKVIKKDLEPPVMTFAPDAFSAYEQGDRDNKFITKTGTEIVLPEPMLTDDSDQPVSLQITVKNPRDLTTILAGNKFTAEMIGTYTVEYIATDVSGKETRRIYHFIVRIDRGDEEEPEKPAKKGCRGAAESVLAVAALLAAGGAAAIVCAKKKNK